VPPSPRGSRQDSSAAAKELVVDILAVIKQLTRAMDAHDVEAMVEF
jgi:hypothetical protein